MSWALFSICQAKVSLFFYIDQGFDRLAHGQRSRSEKGDWLTGSGRCVNNKALGRHSRSLECLFRGIRDRATRSEVKCSSYTSWIMKVKNTDSSKEFQFLFSAELSLPAMWSDFLWLLGGQRTGCRLISCTCSIERTGASRLLFGLVSFHESSKGEKRQLPQNVPRPRRFPHFCLLVEVRSNWNILWRDPRLIARQLLQPLAYIHISRLTFHNCWTEHNCSIFSLIAGIPKKKGKAWALCIINRLQKRRFLVEIRTVQPRLG